MKLENQVASLELSKKLKELGVKQESFLYWVEKENTVDECKVNRFSKYDGDFFFVLSNESDGYECSRETGKRISAFTVAELGEMLPDGTRTVQDTISGRKDYIVNNINGITQINCQAGTEADARAKMLIYLIENKLIKI